MSVDLNRLLAFTRAEYRDPELAAAAFWEAVRGLAKTDLLAYGLFVHGQEAPIFEQLAFSRHALVIACALEVNQKCLLVTPPEHAKSTLMRWHVEQWLGQETEKHFENLAHPAPCVIYAMNTAIQAVRMAKAMASTIEGNSRYHELYPHVQPDPSWGWSSEQFYLKRLVPRPDPSLFPVGVTGPIQGMRAGMGVVDDPTNQKDARSPRTMQDQIDWRLGMYSDRLTDGALERDIMTRWSDTDTFETLSKDEERGVLVMPACADMGKPGYWSAHPERGITIEHDVLWPEVWPYRRLMAKKREKLLKGDGGLWVLTYLCDPKKAEGRMFKREWYRYGLPLEGPPVPEVAA